jgi:hypothetical protein
MHRYQMLTNPPGGEFTSTRLCPSGTSPFDPSNYTEYPFNFHMVVKNLTQSGQDARSDCALAYDLDLFGVVHRKPVLRWPMPDYWQKNLVGIGAVGLAKLPNPASLDAAAAGPNRKALTIY